jgi:FMN phosphatase YigB (HAD superfamily)
VREDVTVAVTFLVDVDNTLVDNDRFRDDVRKHLAETHGEEARDGYWQIQERRFDGLGYRDYLGAVQEWWEAGGRDPRRLATSRYLLEYPFAERLYPGALDVLAHLRTLGSTVVLTDGDAIFQPHKVVRAGLWEAVDGHVLVYVHKEDELEDVERRYPADRYVLVDDKPRILAAAKEHWGERVTTVLPLQGQFAAAGGRPADLTIPRLADLLDVTFD